MSARDVLFVAPVLPIDVQRQAEILNAAGRLRTLVTRYAPTASARKNLQLSKLTRPFSARPSSPVARERLAQVRRADVIYEVVRRATGSRLVATEVSFNVVDRAAARHIDNSVAAVIGREDCCKQTFARAREEGVQTRYLLPTAYWRFVRELMQKEREEFPHICAAADDEREYSPNRNARKDAELKSADAVLCPSSFAASTVESLDGAPPAVTCLPFASDASPEHVRPAVRRNVLLYAGNITMRKGVHRLLTVWKQLKAYRTYELRLIGDMFLQPRFLKDFSGLYSHLPRMPRSQLVAEYMAATAFIFNSMADGFGYVLLEAMSCGTPVISSRNSGAPDVVENGTEGLLVDYGDDAALGDAIDRLLSNPATTRFMGEAALIKTGKGTWENYAPQFLRWVDRGAL